MKIRHRSICDIMWMFPNLVFYCNHETCNVMISKTKKLKTGLFPNKPKKIEITICSKTVFPFNKSLNLSI